MDIKEHIWNAKTDLARNKLRTGLSMLGIIIGVFSVVVMLAIGNGTQQSIVDKIQALGTNLLTISPGGRSWNVRGEGGASSSAILDEDMVSYIKSNISNISAIAPSVNGRKQVIYGSFNTNATINGVTPDYLSVRNLKVKNGSFFTDQDITSLNKVAVLGQDIALDIFGSGKNAQDPIGKDIKMENIIVTIIGVLDDNSISNSTIFIPLSTAQTRVLGNRDYSSISMSAIDTDIVDQTKSELETSLKKYLGIKESASSNFTVQSQSDMISTVSDITGIMTAFLAGIAAISLLVGGIGVMNIMLVSVTERIKEIGIRKAIGAHKRDIMLQFLSESVLLSLIGGIIGILLSFAIVFVINKFITAIISWNAVILAFTSAVSIGIVFGILPANNASKLKPIEALRYE